MYAGDSFIGMSEYEYVIKMELNSACKEYKEMLTRKWKL